MRERQCSHSPRDGSHAGLQGHFLNREFGFLAFLHCVTLCDTAEITYSYIYMRILMRNKSSQGIPKQNLRVRILVSKSFCVYCNIANLNATRATNPNNYRRKRHETSLRAPVIDLLNQFFAAREKLVLHRAHTYIYI